MKSLEELDAIMNTPEYQERHVRETLEKNDDHMRIEHEGEVFYLVKNDDVFQLLNAKAQKLDLQDYAMVFRKAKELYNAKH